MPVLVEFDPSELLSGEDNRLKRQAHCMKVKACAPTWAYKVTLFQCAHQSDLDPRRHITFWAWNEKGECFGPIHENFSYQEEQDFIAMIACRPSPVTTFPSSSVSSSTSTSSTGSSVSPMSTSASSVSSSTSSGTGSFPKPSDGLLSKDPPSAGALEDGDDGRPFQLVTRKRRKFSHSGGNAPSPYGKSRF